MTLKQASTQALVASNVLQPATDLHGKRWFVAARLLWLAFAALVVAINVIGVPRDWYAAYVPCTSGMPCFRPRLYPHEIRVVESYGIPFGVYATSMFSVRLLTAVLYIVVPSVIYWRKPHDGMALFGAYMLLSLGMAATSFVFVAQLSSAAWHMLMQVVMIASEAIMTFFFALFPTKTFVPRLLRWFAPLLVAVNTSFYMGLYIFEPAHLNWGYELTVRCFNAVWLGTLGASQLYRFRWVSSPIERQQTKWVVLGATLGLGFNGVLMLVSFVLGLLKLDPSGMVLIGLRSLYYLLGLLVPLTFGVAILRDGLYDLDVWIRRAVVYGLLTGIVITVYVVLVGTASTLLRVTDNLLVSLLVTGLIAVIFQPLRERLQRAVNRLLYGEREDPYTVLARLGQRLADTVAPDAVFPTLVGTIREALKLPWVAIAVYEQSELVTVATAGERVTNPVRLPLHYQHTLVGELLLGLNATNDRLAAADQRLLTDLAQQVSIAVHAAGLTRDVQVSRERLVTAREEERLRLRRDLHDGLGPTLAGLSMQLDTARALIPDNPAASIELLGETQGEIKEAIANVRQLVYALRPPALDQFGLLAALREHAARETQRYRVAITLNAPHVLPQLPAAVEVAAYYIALEAITNVVRHARATQCSISLRSDSELHVMIKDNGVGLPPLYQGGVGLHSMQERAAELGGTCTITTAPDGGVVVVAALPLGRR